MSPHIDLLHLLIAVATLHYVFNSCCCLTLLGTLKVSSDLLEVFLVDNCGKLRDPLLEDRVVTALIVLTGASHKGVVAEFLLL